MKHALIVATALLTSICLCTGEADARKRRPPLPETVQVPQSRPAAPDEQAQKPAPNAEPEASGSETETPEGAAPETADVPTPEPRPANPEPAAAQQKSQAPPPTDSADLRADEACRARLTELKVVFKAQPALADDQGCSVPLPVEISSLGDGLAIEPPAVLNCPMAEAAARFAQSVIKPAAKEMFGSDLASVANASGYVCRPRNGSQKLSEHAFGNALDMAGFRLADGRTIEVKATDEAKPLAFLAKLRKAACGPFKTVLGPGSDADHATHFHVDLAHRRSGATFCQ